MIRQVLFWEIEKQVVFSAPSISSEIKRSGDLFQAKFENRSNQEWFGTVIKTNLVAGTGAADKANQQWDAAVVMRTTTPEKRNIWTALPGSSGKNNFHKGMEPFSWRHNACRSKYSFVH